MRTTPTFLAIVAVCMILLAGCGESQKPTTGATTSKPADTTLTTSSDDSKKWPLTWKVKQGDVIELQIENATSKADQVHLHGYDIPKDVEPGETAKIRFVAENAGVFEVELEKAGDLIANLSVYP